MSAYPEHEKLKACRAETQAAGEFIDWLTHAKGLRIDNGIDPAPPLRDLLAEWKGIDRDALENEKLVMLAKLAEDLR